jgi:hypothetical protein
MDTIRDERGPRAGEAPSSGGAPHEEMEASARVLLAADGAHLEEAMNSVRWERRGLLQRLTRRPG